VSSSGIATRGFRIMIRIKHRFVSSGILLAAKPHSRDSSHEEPEDEMSIPELFIVFLSHWMANGIYPDMCGYIPDSDEEPAF